MGRDALIELLHGYYWGRMDMRNWTKEDDKRLINKLLSKFGDCVYYKKEK